MFSDPARPEAATALQRLGALGIEVKIVTGDNGAVAVRLWADLGLVCLGAVTGPELDTLDDEQIHTLI